MINTLNNAEINATERFALIFCDLYGEDFTIHRSVGDVPTNDPELNHLARRIVADPDLFSEFGARATLSINKILGRGHNLVVGSPHDFVHERLAELLGMPGAKLMTVSRLRKVTDDPFISDQARRFWSRVRLFRVEEHGFSIVTNFDIDKVVA